MGYMPNPADVVSRFDEIVVDQSASLQRWADLMGAAGARHPDLAVRQQPLRRTWTGGDLMGLGS
jgi:hypothetical protein